jgi:hypothetical protein
MKYPIKMGSGAVVYIRSIIKIGSGIQNGTKRQYSFLIHSIYFLLITRQSEVNSWSDLELSSMT